jgi:hypothetical protein
MIDSVLSTNREIVLSVSNILKCSCSSSSQVQLVLTLICGKLIAWYRAVIRADDDVSDSPSSSSSMVRAVVNNNLNDKDLTERVLHQPITVGEYSLDMALEGKLRAQIVFSELQQLEGLIERLSRRIQEARLGNLDTAAPARSANASAPRASAAHVAVDLDYPTPPPPDETGLAEVTHPSLCSFLQKQLQVAKAETTQILSNERSAARGGFKGTFSLG